MYVSSQLVGAKLLRDSLETASGKKQLTLSKVLLKTDHFKICLINFYFLNRNNCLQLTWYTVTGLPGDNYDTLVHVATPPPPPPPPPLPHLHPVNHSQHPCTTTCPNGPPSNKDQQEETIHQATGSHIHWSIWPGREAQPIRAERRRIDHSPGRDRPIAAFR